MLLKQLFLKDGPARFVNIHNKAAKVSVTYLDLSNGPE